MDEPVEKQQKLKDFKYVDVWCKDAQGRSSGEWVRIPAKEVPKFQQETAKNYNCFATIQRFASKERTKGEAYAAPLFFDLDYDADPATAKAEAVKIVNFFTQDLDIQETDIQVFFSGSKGFHILIGMAALGIEPGPLLHKAFNHIARYLRYRLGDTEIKPDEEGRDREVIVPLKSVDPVVYTSSRMLRLENSIHGSTRLFKIPLSLEELRTLTLDQIKELAKEPRTAGPTKEEREEARGLRDKAAAFYQDKVKEYEQGAKTARDRYNNEELKFDKDNPPVCVKFILENGWLKPGDRNQATIQMACYMKDAGFTQKETEDRLEAWVLDHTTATDSYARRQRAANTRSVIEAIYSKDNEYKFGCAFVRSLHEDKENNPEYKRIPCTGDLCPCKTQALDAEEATPLHLAQTSRADLTGKLVRTKVMVAGKKSTPYIVPKKIEYSCWGHEKCKKYGCPLYNIDSGTLYKELSVKNRELVQMTATGDDNIKGIITTLGGIPCQKYDTQVSETTNIDELLVIPMAQDTDDEPDEANSGKYVLRKVYAVGALSISENKYYELEGYVFPHPKTQEGTILIKSAKPLQDVVDSFKLTDEIKADLVKTFGTHEVTPEAIAEKVEALCNDLTYNVTHIVERDEALLGVLLTYHSILRFPVPWNTTPIRGWLEMAAIGDTGTGKSEMIEKLMKYIGLGTRVNAESTSRTGLTYKMEQSGAGGAWYIVWGAWPLADREFIWIDEMTGITKDEYGEMTLARSDGKLEVKRAVTAETPCRVRAVLTGNPPSGKRLSEYAQGVQSFKDIFNNEDIRRFDFAVFMRKSDVPDEVYNQALATYPVQHPADALKNSILFAWSRSHDDVIFKAGAIDRVLEVATSLSKVYGNATAVPIVSPSDQRNKVARLAVALAALTHSVDESGERIEVFPGHVDFIHEYLKGIYNAAGCGLNYFARLSIREDELDGDKFKKLDSSLKELDTLKNKNKYSEFIELFARSNYLRQGDIEAMLSIDKDETKSLIQKLTKLRMVDTTSGGFRKTSRFNAYITKCFEMGRFDDLENDL